MRTRINLDLDDRTRARIRAFYGKSGLATRQEITRFVLDELEQSVKELPEPKTRGAKAEAPEQPTLPALTSGTGWRARAEAAPAHAVCAKCGKIKDEHGKASFSCPISRSVRPGSRFALKEEAVTA